MILTKDKAAFFNIDAEINDKIQSGKIDELLLIVPTNRKIRSLKKEIISSAPGQSIGKLNIETIGTFSTKLLFGNSEGYSLLSESAAIILLRQSFQDSTLNYFSNYKKMSSGNNHSGDIPQGTLERIRNVISEYKKHGISPEQIMEESKLLSESEKLKAIDIAILYKNYQAKCEEVNTVEIGDVYSKLNLFDNKKFNDNFRFLYPNVSLIIIMGFDEFTAPEIEIINSSSELSTCKLFLSFDYYLYNPLVFSHLDNCYQRLLRKGFNEITDQSPNFSNRFETDIRGNLFRKKAGIKIGTYADKIYKLTAKTREKEIELTAKEIKKLIAYDGIEPHKICVAFNLIGKYSPFIRDIFSVYGIPFNLTDRYSLDTSPPVISIINFLEILENDFYYKNIFRALNGGFIRLKGINLSNLLKASVNLKIISGYENWRQHLQDAIRKYIEEDEEDSNKLLEKSTYEKALSDIELIAELLAPLNKKMRLDEFKKKLYDIIYYLNIPSVMINNNNYELEENIKAVTTFLDTINELLELFKVEYGEKEKFSLKFYLSNIRTAVSSARYNIKEKPGFGVQVTTMNEIRGLSFDYLFLSGLIDGDFPTRYSPEIFFSGSYAKNENNHQVEERYLFYQSLCSWKKRLYLTYPQQEERKELSESNFLTEFTGVFNVSNKNEKDYSNIIFSQEELLIELGKNGVDKLKCYPLVSNEIVPGKLDEDITINSLRIMSPFTESEFTGHLGADIEPGIKGNLRDYKHKQYSISQLETYAKCPYKYFVERVLGLQSLEEPSEEIEALEMGSLLHEILYRFYKTLREKGITLQNSTGEQFSFAEKLIFEIAKDRIEKAGFHSSLAFYEKEKILGINGNQKNSLLYKFLLLEKEDLGDFVPDVFEKGFGNIEDDNGQADLFRQPLMAGSVYVRGKIDRIDINHKDKTFKVVDYKLSGKKPSSDDITKAISLQLPLYMYAAKEFIKEQLNEEFYPHAAEIYSLKFSQKDFGKKGVSLSGKKNLSPDERKKLNEDTITTCLNAINEYVENISSGKFNLSSLKDKETKVCVYCDYKSICRVQEIN